MCSKNRILDSEYYSNSLHRSKADSAFVTPAGDNIPRAKAAQVSANFFKMGPRTQRLQNLVGCSGPLQGLR